MSNVRQLLRDRFTFSLQGMTATASFFITPVLADDRINRAWDEKLNATGRQGPERPALSLPGNQTPYKVFPAIQVDQLRS